MSAIKDYQAIYEYRKRRQQRLDAKRADDEWKTIKGTHVLVDDDGEIAQGPERLKNVRKPKKPAIEVGGEMKPINTDYSYADGDDEHDFTRKNIDKLKEIYEEHGIEACHDEWLKFLMHNSTKDIHRTSKDDADGVIYDNVRQSLYDGWFRNADSSYKPVLTESVIRNPDMRNAALNLAYENYKWNTKEPLSFEEFLTTPIKMYRGESGQKHRKDDVFDAYTFDKKTAEYFADKSGRGGGTVTEIEVRPIDTYGSMRAVGEAEIWVPRQLSPVGYRGDARADGITWEWSDPMKFAIEDRINGVKPKEIDEKDELIGSIIQDAETIKLFADKDDDVGKNIRERCVDMIQRTIKQLTTFFHASNGDGAFFSGELNDNIGERNVQYPEVDAFRERRQKRLDEKSDGDGRWVTTESDNKIHIGENGVPDKGNPYVLAAANSEFNDAARDADDAIEFWMNLSEEQQKRVGKGYKELYEKIKPHAGERPEWVEPRGSVSDMPVKKLERPTEKMRFKVHDKKAPGSTAVADADLPGEINIYASQKDNWSDNVFYHEMGHQLSHLGLGADILQNPGNLWGRFNRKKKVFESPYGNLIPGLSPEESFAEMFSDYIGSPDRVKEKAPQVYEYFGKLFKENPWITDWVDKTRDEYNRVIKEYEANNDSRFDEEPDSWITVNGSHIPIDEDGNPIGGQQKALGAQGKRAEAKQEKIDKAFAGWGGEEYHDALDRSREANYDREQYRFFARYMHGVGYGADAHDAFNSYNYHGDGLINGMLRGSKPKSMSQQKEWRENEARTKEHIDMMTKAIDECPLREAAVVHRGVKTKSAFCKMLGMGVDDAKNLEQLFGNEDFRESLVGRTFSDAGFTSTSIDPDFPSRGNFDNTCSMEIYCPKGTKGVYCGDALRITDESEYLLQRGTQFVITDVGVEEKPYGRGKRLKLKVAVVDQEPGDIPELQTLYDVNEEIGSAIKEERALPKGRLRSIYGKISNGALDDIVSARNGPKEKAFDAVHDILAEEEAAGNITPEQAGELETYVMRIQDAGSRIDPFRSQHGVKEYEAHPEYKPDAATIEKVSEEYPGAPEEFIDRVATMRAMSSNYIKRANRDKKMYGKEDGIVARLFEAAKEMKNSEKYAARAWGVKKAVKKK